MNNYIRLNKRIQRYEWINEYELDSSKKTAHEERLNNKIHWILNETWRKNKQMFPDFSGKYHEKITRK